MFSIHSATVPVNVWNCLWGVVQNGCFMPLCAGPPLKLLSDTRNMNKATCILYFYLYVLKKVFNCSLIPLHKYKYWHHSIIHHEAQTNYIRVMQRKVCTTQKMQIRLKGMILGRRTAISKRLILHTTMFLIEPKHFEYSTCKNTVFDAHPFSSFCSNRLMGYCCHPVSWVDSWQAAIWTPKLSV